MANHQELLVCTSDVEVLATMLAERRMQHSLEAEAAELLAALLMEARLLPDEQLPGDRITMRSGVVYQEEPDGERRQVVLSYPPEANSAERRISVLSPVGMALLGRAPGDQVAASMPGGRKLRIRILEKL